MSTLVMECNKKNIFLLKLQKCLIVTKKKKYRSTTLAVKNAFIRIYVNNNIMHGL